VKDQFGERGIVVDNAIGFWIHRVYQASRNEMYRVFREHGEEVTPEQWAVLIRLWERDGRSQSELSESTFRDAPTMSRIVDGMESRGLLERRPHPGDGRVRVIHLTRKGRELERVLVPLVQQIVERMVEGIAERDLVTTRAALRRMFANLAGD
jgi:MarR family transcriptional regulator, organic hydroperoxide resistance regulator